MKRNHITDHTRITIIAAFWKLYQVMPIEQITVHSLMETAGYHRSTFYMYFDGIYDVLDALEQGILDDIKQIVTMIQDQLHPSLSEDVLPRIAELYEKNGAYMLVLLGDDGDPSFIRKLKTALKPLLTGSIPMLAPSPQSVSCTDESFLCEYISSTVLNMLHFYLKSGRPIPVEEYIVLVRQLVFNGLSGIVTL